MTEYRNEIKVIANFSNQEVDVKDILIPAKSLIIINGQERIYIYHKIRGLSGQGIDRSKRFNLLKYLGYDKI